MEASQVPMEGLGGKALWRALNKEKTLCPSCQKTLSRRALRWKHHCPRPPARVDLGAKRAMLDQRAAEGFRARVEGMVLGKGDAERGAVEGAPLP
jgi:hypothetical protein